MTSSHSAPAPCQWFPRLASALDRRSAPRLVLLFLGAILAHGRRTVTSWIWAAGLSGEYRPRYAKGGSRNWSGDISIPGSSTGRSCRRAGSKRSTSASSDG